MNKVKYGLKNVHYAVITETNGVVNYATPKKIPGAVSLTLDAQSAPTRFFADDVSYFESETNQGYAGTLEMALLTDDFRKDVLGEEEDVNGVLIENKNAKPKPFALLFEFDGDQSATRHVLYNVYASRPNLSSTTKGETVDVQPETLSIRAVPAMDTGDVKAKVTADLAPYAGFFEDVYIKTTIPEGD